MAGKIRQMAGKPKKARYRATSMEKLKKLNLLMRC